MTNLSNMLLNSDKQNLVAKRSTAIVHRKNSFLLLFTHYLNLVFQIRHSGRGGNNHPHLSCCSWSYWPVSCFPTVPWPHSQVEEPVLHPHCPCWLPQISPSSATSFWGCKDQTCVPHTNCRNTMDLYSSTVLFPVWFHIFLLLPDICLSVVTTDEKVELTFSLHLGILHQTEILQKQMYHCTQVKSVTACVT